eukprot:2337750-Pyramimonas_sp.AAC.1
MACVCRCVTTTQTSQSCPCDLVSVSAGAVLLSGRSPAVALPHGVSEGPRCEYSSAALLAVLRPHSASAAQMGQ